MRISSIQFKFLMTVLSAILIIAVLVGGFSIYEVDRYVQEHTEELITATCANEATQINDTFGDIEKSVRIMASYVLSFYTDTADITDTDKQQAVIQFADEMFVDIASNTAGIIAYYLRLDPATANSKAGIFHSKAANSEGYVRFDPTDLALYDPEDVNHVGWFWLPYNAGEPMWLPPYYNENNRYYTISYVVPMYYEGHFIGVVGMDFDYTKLIDLVHNFKIFENGFAHLELNGSVIHSGHETIHHDPLDAENEDYFAVSKELANGMTLNLFASRRDIRQIRYNIELKILLAVILIAAGFAILVFFIVRQVVNPLKRLAEASVKLSQGDYDVEIAHGTTYEVRQLSRAFENMLVKLREHKKLQHLLAYRDSLTGLRNTTSYKEWVVDFDKKIREEDTAFSVLVLDINYLKEANDTYGHIVGNNLIKTAAHLIAETFKRSPVFRIGGDEFLAILQNKDLEDCDRLLAEFDHACANTFIEADDTRFPVSIAKGISRFDPAKDTQFSDVFDRADDEMYKNKKMTKMAGV